MGQNDLKLLALVLLCGVLVAGVIGWRATSHPPKPAKTTCVHKTGFGSRYEAGRCPYFGG
jgi:hypothetical protein